MTAHNPEPHNSEDHQPSNGYPPFQPENETEVARLLMQHRQLSEFLGDILPKSLDLSNVHRVLDVACGVGAWVLDMARRHPAMQVIGIDKSQYFIEQARTMALSEQLTNATFIVQNMLHLEGEYFTSESFDLINIRCIAGEITAQEFPPLLQFLVHLCKPGGILHWLEAEMPITNSPAFQQLAAMILQGLKAADRTFSPSNNFLGITACMAAWFHDAGCRIVQDSAHAIDISAGTTAHAPFHRQAWIFGHQVQPFLLATRVTTLTEFEEVFKNMQKEIQAPTFCGICFLREVVAVKLREGERLEVFR
jgi:ubiquinone/menaquinone biosynthesis C-methylase UbiE